MYDLSPLLSFAASNGPLQKRLKERDYGTIEEHLDALGPFKMYMPDVLDSDTQVHMGLLLNIMLTAANDPAKGQEIKDIVDAKWLESNSNYPHSKVPKKSYFTTGNVASIIVGCSRDPHFRGMLLDNPRCVIAFRDDVTERIDHSSIPIYVDSRGNMKLFYDGDSDTCNIFMEDATLEIPERSWQYLYDRGIKKAIISEAGTKGFESISTVTIANKIAKHNSDSTNAALWILVALLIALAIVAIAFYSSYVMRRDAPTRVARNREGMNM